MIGGEESFDVDENVDVFAIAPSPPTKTDDCDWVVLEKRKRKKVEVIISEQFETRTEPDGKLNGSSQPALLILQSMPVQSVVDIRRTDNKKEQDTSKRKLEGVMSAAAGHSQKDRQTTLVMEAVPGK